MAGRVRPIRLGRGNAPLELELPIELDTPLLAVGAFLKNTVALASKRRAVISPHIGELESPRAVAVFGQVVDDLQALYGVQARGLACDAHPDFPNSRWARDHAAEHALPLTRVFHHEAHASALAGEFDRMNRDTLVFAWDGVGYGRDGEAWGGEVLHGRPGNWRRVASLKKFRLPGGDRATRQPWRTAQSIAWHAGFDWPDAPEADPLLRRAWETGLASPWTSAAGRLFDAAAALARLGLESSYEGQGPSRLEALARRGRPVDAPRVALAPDEAGLPRADWRDLMRWMGDPGIPAAARALGFHAALARWIAETVQHLQSTHHFNAVGLTGGVFQNALLAELAIDALTPTGTRLLIPERIPVNDAGIAYGQVIETSAACATTPSAPRVQASR